MNQARLLTKFVCASGLALLIASGPRPAAAAYQTIINNGPSSNRADIVFVGDGYRSSDIAAGTYTNHISQMVAHIFDQAQDPFPRYRKFFNVHRIDVVSNEAGADVPPLGIYRDTALDASYYYDGVTDRLLYINTSKANNAITAGLSGSGFSAEWKLVTVNDTRYGGGGGSYAVYAGGNSSSTEVALHESGHSFGSLADEYWYAGQTYGGGEPGQVNVTKNSNPSTVKWSNWVGYTDPAHPEMGAIGVYEGAYYCQYGAYRPSSNSKMRALGRQFDAVSREQLILQIYNYVHPLDSWRANGSSLVDPGQLWVDTVDPDVIKVQWYVNGSAVSGATAENFSPAQYGYRPGSYQVTAKAADDMIGNWVRRSTDKLQQDIAWTVQVTLEPGDSDGDGVVGAGDYANWFNHYSTAGGLADGDFNGDGFVDQTDYAVWFNNYGLGGVAAPEPGTLALLAISSLAISRRRR